MFEDNNRDASKIEEFSTEQLAAIQQAAVASEQIVDTASKVLQSLQLANDVVRRNRRGHVEIATIGSIVQHLREIVDHAEQLASYKTK